MKKSAILSAALLVIAVSASPSTVRADSADATCQLRGPGTKGLSAPCTFSQRQGYIDVTLQGGGTYSFSPGKDSSHYTDKKGERVDRTLLVGDSQEFRWQDGRTLTVTYKAASTSGGGGGAAGAVAVADMSRYCAGEASAKFGVSPRDIKTENAKQTQGMYEVWGQYGANAQVFICSFNAERQFLSVDLYRP
jgi:hypothetical protein